ncbi:citrate synthase [Ceratobasidium sp. UAMH 11750]|nr:citrate synthase [Ceratobasidium sp. UAMH 11750]
MVAGGGTSVGHSDVIATKVSATSSPITVNTRARRPRVRRTNTPSLIVDLITRGTPHFDGKILIVGGAIANFTNIPATFKASSPELPGRSQGQRLLGECLGVPIKVYGPETHITDIVPLVLGVAKRAPQTKANVVQSVAPTPPGSPKGAV